MSANIFNENNVVLCFDISFFQSNLCTTAIEEDRYIYIYICTNLQFIRKRDKTLYILGKTKVSVNCIFLSTKPQSI